MNWPNGTTMQPSPLISAVDEDDRSRLRIRSAYFLLHHAL